jgi:hypothetical protein
MDFLASLFIKFGSENINCGLSTRLGAERHLEPPVLGMVPYL